MNNNVKKALPLVGRNEEASLLEKLFQSARPEFLALYGRRRIGKTYLIRAFFSAKSCIFFNLTGMQNGSMREQLTHFTERLGEIFLQGLTPQPSKNWNQAFAQLNEMIERSDTSKKVVIFLDELPWLATKRSKLLATLDYYWNQYWSTNGRIKLIVCGSSASWIINNIINNRGGLHNRLTYNIHLKPFNLSQTKQFLQHHGVKLSNRHVLEVYSVLGGVPYYLERIEKGMSARQIITHLVSTNQPFLAHEFDKLYASLFDQSDYYTQVVKLLAAHHEGIGERTLLEKLGKNFIGARGKKILNDLEQTGFIRSFIPLYHKRRGRYYRLIDEYSLFYLRWIIPVKSEIIADALESSYWSNLQTSSKWQNWQGYAFESICQQHIIQIKRALQLSPSALSSTWRYTPQRATGQRGAQIDLLFDREDDAITLCEIKYTKLPFTINKDYAEVIERKLDVFKYRTNTSKQLFVALISASGIKQNSYSEQLVSAVVTVDDLFKEIK